MTFAGKSVQAQLEAKILADLSELKKITAAAPVPPVTTETPYKGPAAPSPGEASTGDGSVEATHPVPPVGADAIPSLDPIAQELATTKAELKAQREQESVTAFMRAATAKTRAGNPVVLAPEAVAVLAASKGGVFDVDASGAAIVRVGEKVFPVTTEGLTKLGIPGELLGSPGFGGTGSRGGVGATQSGFKELSDRDWSRLTTAQKREYQKQHAEAMKGGVR